MSTSEEVGSLKTRNFITFGMDSVVNLQAEDFDLTPPLYITLKEKRCVLVLFYNQLQESQDLMKIWADVSTESIGPIYTGCNVSENPKIGQAFASVSSQVSNPLHSVGLKGWPVIIAYRDGFPTSVYNGDYDTNSLGSWALISACQGKDKELVQLSAGVSYGNRNTTQPKPESYTPDRQGKVKNSSVDFTYNTPARISEGTTNQTSPANRGVPQRGRGRGVPGRGVPGRGRGRGNNVPPIRTDEPIVKPNTL